MCDVFYFSYEDVLVYILLKYTGYFTPFAPVYPLYARENGDNYGRPVKVCTKMASRKATLTHVLIFYCNSPFVAHMKF